MKSRVYSPVALESLHNGYLQMSRFVSHTREDVYFSNSVNRSAEGTSKRGYPRMTCALAIAVT